MARPFFTAIKSFKVETNAKQSGTFHCTALHAVSVIKDTEIETKSGLFSLVEAERCHL